MKEVEQVVYQVGSKLIMRPLTLTDFQSRPTLKLGGTTFVVINHDWNSG